MPSSSFHQLLEWQARPQLEESSRETEADSSPFQDPIASIYSEQVTLHRVFKNGLSTREREVAIASRSKTFPAPDPNPPHPYACVQISAHIEGSQLNSVLSFLSPHPVDTIGCLAPPSRGSSVMGQGREMEGESQVGPEPLKMKEWWPESWC